MLLDLAKQPGICLAASTRAASLCLCEGFRITPMQHIGASIVLLTIDAPCIDRASTIGLLWTWLGGRSGRLII